MEEASSEFVQIVIMSDGLIWLVVRLAVLQRRKTAG